MLEKKRNYINSSRSDPASRFAPKLIVQIVKEVEEGLPRKEACLIHGMAYCTINEWMRKFGSGNGRSVFSDQLKRKVVRSIQEQKITKLQAQKLYKVNKKTLNTWLFNAKKEEAELVTSKDNNMPPTSIAGSVVDLDKQLNDANLKIKALETMIDIAEQQFKISIRKKPGAKQ
jgi:transposase-like protein